MSGYKVIELFTGYSHDKDSGAATSKSNCTCSLILGPKKIIVDTMTAWDGPKLTDALQKHNVKCEDIDFVVCTHGHSDHIGCNYLFQNARHIVGFCVSKGDEYYSHDFESGKSYAIDDKVEIMPTPGHMMQSVSVIVRTVKGVVAITGDLFEREEDLRDDNIWKSAGSDMEHLQALNRRKILDLADWVIPGHGPGFGVEQI